MNIPRLSTRLQGAVQWLAEQAEAAALEQVATLTRDWLVEHLRC